jgi:hypothetical protein
MTTYVREMSSEWRDTVGALRDTVDALRDRVTHLETLSPTTPEHGHDLYVDISGRERCLLRCRGCGQRWNVANRIPIEAPKEEQRWDRVVLDLNEVQP